MIVVADAGPLLALAKIEALGLLRDLYQQVITGPAVYTEAVTAGLAMGASDAEALNEAYQRGQLIVRTHTLAALPHPGLLHAGEEESIRLTIELQAGLLLMDDLDARQVAQRNFDAVGVTSDIKGTLGVIVTAANTRLISPVQAVEMVKTLKYRRDVWLASSLCDAVVEVLHRLP
jgi:predicted nucleic acid-binding protein